MIHRVILTGGLPFGKGTGRISDILKGDRRSRKPGTRAAILVNALRSDQADETLRRPPILSARRCRTAARNPPPVVRRGLYHPRRAAHLARTWHQGGPASRRSSAGAGIDRGAGIRRGAATRCA